MAGYHGTRCRTAVLASLPSRCDVCGGTGVMRAALVGRVHCPHCRPWQASGGASSQPAPILAVPYRREIPRGGVA